MPFNARAIAPQGKLIAIVVAAIPSPFFSCIGGRGTPQGVTVDLAHALATELGIPLEVTTHPNSGEISAAGLAGNGRHCSHSDLGWAASQIRSDVIFGKDSRCVGSYFCRRLR